MSAGRPPALFPDAVTLGVAVSADRLVELLVGRRSCSVKDSYADVDLEPHGFSELFRASWIGQTAPRQTARPVGWSTVTTPAALETWCAAAGLPDVLPEALLVEPSVRVLAAHHHGRLTAGVTVNRSDAVVGISNVFQVDGGNGDRGSAWVWDEVVTVVRHCFPPMPVVGYETGADLDAALGRGFTDLGPLRVWGRPPLR